MADDGERIDLDRTGFELDLLAVAGEVVGALARDLDRGELRRRLQDRAGEARQQGRDGGSVGTQLRGRDDLALGVVGVGLRAPGDGER